MCEGVIFFVIYGYVCRVRNKIMYVLSWRTVSVLTRVSFWCLLSLLLCNSGNKHQNNPIVSKETVRHSSTYIILYYSSCWAICITAIVICYLQSHTWLTVNKVYPQIMLKYFAVNIVCYIYVKGTIHFHVIIKFIRSITSHSLLIVKHISQSPNFLQLSSTILADSYAFGGFNHASTISRISNIMPRLWAWDRLKQHVIIVYGSKLLTNRWYKRNSNGYLAWWVS